MTWHGIFDAKSAFEKCFKIVENLFSSHDTQWTGVRNVQCHIILMFLNQMKGTPLTSSPFIMENKHAVNGRNITQTLTANY